MRVSELKALLASIDDDYEIQLNVGDYYTARDGHTAHFIKYEPQSSISSSHVRNNDAKLLTLNCQLDNQADDYEGKIIKYPKVTYRKK
jgi:hypothetical protein